MQNMKQLVGALTSIAESHHPPLQQNLQREQQQHSSSISDHLQFPPIILNFWNPRQTLVEFVLNPSACIYQIKPQFYSTLSLSASLSIETRINGGVQAEFPKRWRRSAARDSQRQRIRCFRQSGTLDERTADAGSAASDSGKQCCGGVVFKAVEF